mmetsp:Transcript_135294/g.289285  ORF Transcript_135294/g.289285 Transcript_135294/m.289285 type:complete len:250 (-) Transcript_135294:25-774(-)
MATPGGSIALAERTSPGKALAASSPKSVPTGGACCRRTPPPRRFDSAVAKSSPSPPKGRSRCMEPRECGWRMTSCTCPKSLATRAMASSASNRSLGASPMPTRRPVVNGICNSPACRNCSKRTLGCLLGAKRCTPPGPSKEGEVCSNIKPIDALRAFKRSISTRESGPTLVCGRRPKSRTRSQISSTRLAQAARFLARGCTSPAMTRTSTTLEAAWPSASPTKGSKRRAASVKESQSSPALVTSRRKLQ